MSLVGFKARNHPQQKVSSIVDNRATTFEVFELLDRRFHFTIDVAASLENTKCTRFFSSKENGLDCSWGHERVWCNPPFSSIRPWVEKAWYEWAVETSPELIVMLLPANRTEQSWWQELVEPYRLNGQLGVEFLAGRMRFLSPGEDTIKPNSRPPFGCCLVIWDLKNAQVNLDAD